ncbi:hypothetical protein WA158_005551 [Blastocystis sp. Blastoise]
MSDPTEWIEYIKTKGHLPMSQLKRLCETAKEIFFEEGNVQQVSSPVTICGDIHGQFNDLLELFNNGGDVPDTKYIFMVRGFRSVETFQLLMCLKVCYPDRITLLRGNHESKQITQVYGFYDECLRKYQSSEPYQWCIDVFNFLGISALVDGKIFCVHGGLSPDVSTLDKIRTLPRLQEVPEEGALSDLLWSDPEEIEGWQQSPRGAGYLFGWRVVSEFNDVNGLELICRAHQMANEGFHYMFPDKNLVTVWSAPNYCYRCGNLASILRLDEHLERTFLMFKADDKNQLKDMPPSVTAQRYFY